MLQLSRPVLFMMFGARWRDSSLNVELVKNGGMDGDTDWGTHNNVVISGGVATWSGTLGSLNQSIAFVAGGTYRVAFELSGYSSGAFRANFMGGTSVNGTNRTANGSYTQDMIALIGNNALQVIGFSTTPTGVVDNISVKRIA